MNKNLFDINLTKKNVSVSFESDETDCNVTIIEGDVIVPFTQGQKEVLETMTNRVDDQDSFVTARWRDGQWIFNYKYAWEFIDEEFAVFSSMLERFSKYPLHSEAVNALTAE